MNISDKQLDNFDVIIVGGGMVGATQAQALLKQNKKSHFHRIKDGHHGAYGKAWAGTEDYALKYLAQNL